MKKLLLFLFVCIFGLSQAQNAPGYANLFHLDPYNPDFAPGVVLVKFKDEVPIVLQRAKSGDKTGINWVDNFMVKHNIRTLEKIFAHEEKKSVKKSITLPSGETLEVPQLFNIFKFTADSKEDVKAMVAELKSEPLVDFAEPDYFFYSQATEPNDPMTSQQWYLGAFPGVNAKAAWDTTTSDTTQIIGIIDTGVDWAHPDLAPNIWHNWGEIPGNGIDDDGDGYIDDVRGWDFVNNDNNPMDDNSHGTHVAGIAAAKGNNGIGIAGIAWKARIMPIKVMQSSGYGSASDIANGVNYARIKGATILNLSLGGYGESLTLKTALENAYFTAVIVAAAGNDAIYMIQEGIPSAAFYPACYPWIIGVQASTQSGEVVRFSNVDPTGPVFFTNSFGYNYEMTAPGVGILSTFPNGGYHILNGTSMAAPLVSGAIALIKSHNPTLNNEQILARLVQSSTNGVLNIFNALNYNLVPDLYYITNTLIDTLSGDDRDGRADAGETIQLYLKVKNAGGSADSVWSKFRFAPYEDTTVATILDSTSYIGNISTYASMTGQMHPLKIHIKPWVANNRDIMFQYEIGAKNTTQRRTGNIKLTIQKGFEVGGLINTDQTWTPDKEYLVVSNIRVSEGVKLVVKPGTIIKLLPGTSIDIRGELQMVGNKDSLIIVTSSDGDNYGAGIGINSHLNNDTSYIQYVKFTNIYSPITQNGYQNTYLIFCNNIIENCSYNNQGYGAIQINNNTDFSKNLITNNWFGQIYLNYFLQQNANIKFRQNVIQKNYCNYNTEPRSIVMSYGYNSVPSPPQDQNSIFSYFAKTDGTMENNLYIWGDASFALFSNNYWGTRDSIHIQRTLLDFNYSPNSPVLVFWPYLTRPSSFAHGHVWKVSIDTIEINKYDHPFNASNGLGLVGPGKHRFDVYFNRAMDVSITPFVTFGVRDPYTQKVVTDSAFWNSDSTRWTAFCRIGIETGDGINRVRVEGAKDNEYFEIPIEDSRFEFMIQAAGSASIEFMATPGIGKVYLEWNRAGTQDALGYNLYRFQNITDTTYTFPIRINTSLITDTLFTDYNVIPNKTYHYYYKVVSTDLKESDSSKRVVVIPLNAANGDANGDGHVNVLDITTIIAYMLGQNPQPFLFEAADVNNDHTIDILDVIGIVNLINGKKKTGSIFTGTNPDPAYIYLDSTSITFQSKGQVAAIQFELTGKNLAEIELICKQNGFEFAHGLVKGKLTGIIYNLNNQTIPSNDYKPANLFSVNNNNLLLSWGDVLAGDQEGNNVKVYKNQKPGQLNPFKLSASPNPFTNSVTISYSIPVDGFVDIVICNMNGQVVENLVSIKKQTGDYQIYWSGKLSNGSVVPAGIYLCKLTFKDGTSLNQSDNIKIVFSK